MEQIWFLLYAGSSPDGRGNPHYIGRTLNAFEAMEHLSNVANDPYSTGCVKAYKDDSYEYFSCKSDIERFTKMMTKEFENE